MSDYRFSIKNYHAIEEAEIKIDGITVLAGINGSGKSTIARWLHYVVKVLNDYDNMIERDGIENFLEFLSSVRRAIYALPDNNSLKEASNDINEIINEARNSAFTSIADTKELFIRAKELFENILRETTATAQGDIDLKRIKDYFSGRPDGTDTSATTSPDMIIDAIDAAYNNIVSKVATNKGDRSAEQFSKAIWRIADSEIEDDDFEFSFEEDGADLVSEDLFKMPLNLRNEIYIDTQKIGRSISRFEESDLSEMLNSRRPDSGELTPGAIAIARVIQQLIGGDIDVEKGKKSAWGPRRQTYTFVCKDGRRFNLRGAATGIISFSYILQLLKNGWIDSNTMLIIDEPECHLHPQWIVDYARVLVMLQKELGTKILISSHSPEMISAIEAISHKYNTSNVTNFYLSKPNADNPNKFNFCHLGSNIEEIFDSFSVAIDRINRYGE